MAAATMVRRPLAPTRPPAPQAHSHPHPRTQAQTHPRSSARPHQQHQQHQQHQVDSPVVLAAVDLYDPASPWGVLGIAYDPASPRVPREMDKIVSQQTPAKEEEEAEEAEHDHLAKRQRTESPQARAPKDLKEEEEDSTGSAGVFATDTATAATIAAAAAAAMAAAAAATALHTTEPPTTTTTAPPRCPQPNTARDAVVRAQCLRELRASLARARAETPPGTPPTHGALANAAVAAVLAAAQPANTDAACGPVDARFVSGAEARALLDAGAVANGVPVVTAGEQPFAWASDGGSSNGGSGDRPIAQLFRRMERLDRRVAVQVPSRASTGASFESRGVAEVARRFGVGVPGGDTVPDTDDPWNILDLYSPLPPCILPRFLTGENCQLLPRIRDEVLRPDRAERGAALRARWPEWTAWRDVLEWVLLAQGGHCTAPHTDSHGLATWLTVQEGLFGFGWLARPAPDALERWRADPLGLDSGGGGASIGPWRYTVLAPGQTVFFASGTVHFVFRLRGAATLALGGHVLLWTGLPAWLDTVAAQLARPDTTNEDMARSAPLYVRAVARLVAARLRAGRVAELGGAAAARQLLDRLEAFGGKEKKGGRRRRRHNDR